MDQPTPNVSTTDVDRVIARDFPAAEVSALRAALAAYGTKTWHREPERVRLAALKVAGGNVARLREALVIAGQDFRDVLCAAEYPRYGKEINPSEKNETKRQLVIDDDWRQYREWFEKKNA